MSIEIKVGDCREVLATLPAESVHCIVTSPPYWGLRDYGVGGQFGLEPTPEAYVENMVAVFREVRRVLRKDGTLWLNIGDSYSGSGRGRHVSNTSTLEGSIEHEQQCKVARGSQLVPGLHAAAAAAIGRAWVPPPSGLKQKDLVGIPWMLAKALRDPYYTGTIRAERDRVWLAAMIDAEGCLYIHRRQAGQPNGQGYTRKNDTHGAGLEISNTSEAIVQRCLAITGRGSISRQAKDRRQPLYRWCLRTNECREVIREVYPYLVAKGQQARIVLGCPSSGEKAEAAFLALQGLHHGVESTIDFPEPASMFEPGWYLRQDVIWSKPNPMPESVTDRCTKSHEYLFLLTKSERYYYDADAIAEEAATGDSQRDVVPDGWATGKGKHDAISHSRRKDKLPPKDAGRAEAGHRVAANLGGGAGWRENGRPAMRNKRSVWTVATAPFAEAHFATFPPALIEPCILAGCPEGGTVLDPFCGAGTTGLVADRHHRNAILIELNPEYAAMAQARIRGESPLFAQVTS